MSLFSEISKFISATVGNQRENKLEDVRQVKSALNNLGYFDFTKQPELHGYITREMDESIKRYQKDKGLRIDGWLKPKGETESALIKDLHKRASSDDIIVEVMPPPTIPDTNIPDEGIPEGYVTTDWDEYKMHGWREQIDKDMERRSTSIDHGILINFAPEKEKILKNIIKGIKR